MQGLPYQAGLVIPLLTSFQAVSEVFHKQKQLDMVLASPGIVRGVSNSHLQLLTP